MSIVAVRHRVHASTTRTGLFNHRDADAANQGMVGNGGSHPRGTLAATVEISPEYVDLVRRGYDIRDYPAVSTFIQQHPYLVPLLLEARYQIDLYFSSWVPVLLEVVTDPEEGDRALFARIQTNLAPDSALRRLTMFWEGWWLDALPQAHGALHFDIGDA